jgi:hypothetical protein
MAYSGQTFPTLQYGFLANRTKLSFSLPVSVVGNGQYEYRTLRASFPRISYSVPLAGLVWQDKETLLAFWQQMGGQLQSFLFKDPEHNTLNNYVLGSGTQLQTPAAPTLALVGGTMPAMTYHYAVTALNAQGETDLSTPAAVAANGSQNVVVSWSAIAGATAYRVYRRVGSDYLLVGTTGSTSLQDTNITPAGAAPAVNTTGTTQYPLLVPIAGLAHPLFHIDGLTASQSGGAVQVLNGSPFLVFPAGSCPPYGTDLTLTGVFSLCVRFDSSVGYALMNAVNPQSSLVTIDAVKLVEVFE